MIIGAAFVPSAPLLVPEVAAGAAYELDDLRRAAVAALSPLLDVDRVVVIGAGRHTRLHTSGQGTFRGFGVGYDVPLDPAALDGERLPLALSLGAWLLQHVGWTGERAALELDAHADDQALDTAGAVLRDADGRTALLVVADGSAARDEKAPAHLHPEAAAFDASVAAALAAGDPATLAALDRATAAVVTAAGRPAWRAASAALAGTAYDADLLADVAPYGVGYVVARWR